MIDKKIRERAIAVKPRETVSIVKLSIYTNNYIAISIN